MKKARMTQLDIILMQSVRDAVFLALEAIPYASARPGWDKLDWTDFTVTETSAKGGKARTARIRGTMRFEHATFNPWYLKVRGVRSDEVVGFEEIRQKNIWDATALDIEFHIPLLGSSQRLVRRRFEVDRFGQLTKPSIAAAA